MWKGFETLVERGYLVLNEGRNFRYEPKFVPTEKAKPYIQRGPTFNVLLRDYCMQVHVCRTVLKAVTRIEPEAQGRVRVEYETALEPVEPFYSLFCGASPAAGCRPYAAQKLFENARHATVLRQTSAGWQVVP